MKDIKDIKNVSTTEIGRGYSICLYREGDNVGTDVVELRHKSRTLKGSIERRICALHKKIWGDWHYLNAISIMSRIIYTMDRIQEDKDNKMLENWLDDMLKYWGEDTYRILRNEFANDLMGYNDTTSMQRSMEVFKDNKDLLEFTITRILEIASDNLDAEENWANMDADRLGELKTAYDRCIDGKGTAEDWDEMVGLI